MRLFTRRGAARVAAAAPLAVGMAGDSAKYPTPAAPPTSFVGEAGSALQRAVPTPPGWKAFNTAKRAAQSLHAKRYRVQHIALSDLNIIALKSVSPQHKLWMQVEANERNTRESESLIDSLARKFGVLEFWKGSRPRDEMHDDYYSQT